MKDVNWLEVWRNEMTAYTDDRPILELGCGRGVDSQQLTSYGFEVISLDLNFENLRHCKNIAGCYPLNADISANFPFPDDTFGFVLASLSLHYFSWDDTRSIINEIQRILTKPGMLLLRLNSTEDVNFGAGMGEEIDQNYYLYNNQKKRFFEKGDVESMLKAMKVKEIWHDTIDRYSKEKKVWVAQAVV